MQNHPALLWSLLNSLDRDNSSPAQPKMLATGKVSTGPADVHGPHVHRRVPQNPGHKKSRFCLPLHLVFGSECARLFSPGSGCAQEKKTNSVAMLFQGVPRKSQAVCMAALRAHTHACLLPACLRLRSHGGASRHHTWPQAGLCTHAQGPASPKTSRHASYEPAR